MALPTTITGISTAISCVGPFISSGGNVYFFGKDGTTATTLQAYKATDPTSSFSSVATNTGFSTAVQALAGYQVGDVIHLIVADGTGTSINYKYRTFDMSSDSFVTSETIASALNTQTSASVTQFGCSIVVRSGGEVVAFFNGASVASMGNSYAQTYYSRRTGVNTWSAATQVSAGGTNNFTNPRAVVEADDTCNFLYFSGTTLTHRGLSSLNSLAGTATTAFTISSSSVGQAIRYDASGTDKVVYGLEAGSSSGTVTAVRFNGSVTPTMSTASINTSSAGSPVRIFVDAGDSNKVWALFRVSDGDLYVASSTDHGATWSARTNAFVASITTDICSNDAVIFQRGSDFVLPYVVNDNGTLKYNEYVVRSVSSNKTLTADAGSYSFTGTAASIVHGHPLTAGAGSYALTGSAATLFKGHPLAAGTGSYVLTGTAASLLHKWLLTAGAGSYALTGTDASVKRGQNLPAGVGSYSFTGTNANLLHKWNLAAGVGSYSLTGTAAILRRNLPLVAGVGTYTLTGTAANVLHGWKIVAGAGSYALTGSAANLLHGWVVSAGTGAYNLTGTDATVTKASQKVLAAGVGSYSLTGTDANVLHGWRLTAGAGSYALTGTNASLLHKWNLTAGVGAYSFTGTSATLSHAWRATAGAGSYALTGSTANVLHGGRLAAGAGSYSLSGTDANPLHGWRLNAGVGSYALTGTDAALTASSQTILAADGGSYSLSGSAATVSQLRKLIADSDIYVLSGSDASLTIASAATRAVGWSGRTSRISEREFERLRRERFSDKYYRELLGLEQAIEAAEEAAPQKTAKAEKAVRNAAELAEKAAETARQVETEELHRLSVALQSAASSRKSVEAIRRANEAAKLAKAIISAYEHVIRIADEDEEEAIELLLMS